MSDVVKPFLFLDVDGVILPFGIPDGDLIELRVDNPPVYGVNTIYVSNEVMVGIERLKDAYEVVWATGWNEKAPRHLAGPLGLRGCRSIIFDKEIALIKHPDILDFLAFEPRPFAWVDDMAIPDDWLDGEFTLPVDHLLVKTDGEVGLTPEDVDDMLLFASRTTTTLSK